jgi:hypothetical protein
MIWLSVDTWSPALVASAMIGPANWTTMAAGIKVRKGASTEQKITRSSSRMKMIENRSTLLP